jgi:hypothetical protein
MQANENACLADDRLLKIHALRRAPGVPARPAKSRYFTLRIAPAFGVALYYAPAA